MMYVFHDTSSFLCRIELPCCARPRSRAAVRAIATWLGFLRHLLRHSLVSRGLQLRHRLVSGSLLRRILRLRRFSLESLLDVADVNAGGNVRPRHALGDRVRLERAGRQERAPRVELEAEQQL